MAKLVALAQDNDAKYSIQSVHGLELVYSHPKLSVDQLVILISRGLHLFYFESCTVVLWWAIWVYER